MTTLEAARAYAARGWSVVPLVPGTKRPAVEVAPFLRGEQRLDDDGLVRYWGGPRGVGPEGEPTRYGIAIICGRPSGGLVVVDVDPRNGGDCEAATRDCPTEYAVRTGGGGLHLYCQSDALVPKGKTGRQGVDRQGDGSYVVAPPSLHPDGGVYVIEREGSLGPVPPWVLGRPGPPLPGHAEPNDADDLPGGVWVSGTLADPTSVRPGTQEETLTRLAWWAAGALDQDVAEAVLWRWAQGLTLGNPRQPWTIEHVHQKLTAAYAKREPAFEVTGSGSAAPATTAADAEAAVAALEALVVPASAYVVSNRQDWIVEHVAAPGCFTEIVGEVKKGKTTFNSQMIRCVLSGEPFLGWKVRKTGVVLYSEQVGLSLEATLERAGVRRADGLYLLDQSQAFGRPWPQVVCALLRKCQAVGAQLLFVDTLTRLAGVAGEAENQSGVVSILDPFRAAKAMGIAVVFVRHASKSRENREDASRAGRGSTAITGDMDIAVNLYQPGSEDVRRVRTISRLGEEVTALLQYDGSGYTAVAEGSVPTTARDRKTSEVRDAVEAEFRSGNTTAAGIAKAIGKDRKTVRRYLQQVTGGFTIEGEGSDADD